MKEAILREATSVTSGRFPGAICADRSDSVIVLIPLDLRHSAERNRETLNDHARLLQRTLHGQFKSLTVSVGIGRSRPRPTDIPRSYDEARQALTLGRELYGTGVVVHFDDLGLFRFLTRGADRTEIVDFVEEHLGALLRHDQKHGSHLVDTLQAFLGANRNIRQAAQALFVHENTLKYRLQRICQLGGLDLENAEVCFNLQVALRMHQLTSR
jgi:purine catabolism regulator